MRKPVFHRMTDYDRRLLPNAHLRAMDENATDREGWVEGSGYSVGYPAWGLLYYLTLCRLDPDADSLIIETGTNQGASSVLLAQAISDSRGTGVLRTVELEADNVAKAKANVEKAGLTGLVEFHEGDAIEMLPTMLEGDRPLAVAFLDGSHLHDQVISEFELVQPRLEPDSLVIFDNTYRIAEPHEDQRVHGALHTILDRFGGSLVNLPYCSWYTPGVAVWQRRPFEDINPPA
ncbi:MAG: class I SAM-dependent methyltransferase [Planctomycetota bacterium]